MSSDKVDRRDHTRHDTKLAIRFRDRRNLKGEFIKNISYGGVFVCTTDPMPTGSDVDLTLEAPDGRTLQIKGHVVWSSLESTEPGVEKEENDAPPADTAGMGIRFADKKQAIEDIKAFIDSITDTDS